MIRNFAVNSDFPQAAGIVNYLQLLQQSPKGIEYERYTAAEQESQKQQTLTEMKDWANANGRDPVLSAIHGKDTNGVLNLPSGVSLITAPLQGADYVLDALETAYVGFPLPSSTPDFTETTQTLREGVSQDMTETGKFVYNTAMSAADSVIAGKLGGKSIVGGIILGMGAASNTANDIKNRGGTDEEALIGGAVSGILEGVFEKVSLGQLKAMQYLPVNTVKDILGNTAKSVVTNAGEELSTELANIVFDTIFMDELSTYALSVDGYLAQGNTEAEAKRLAGRDLLARLGESAASGALTGVMFGTGASTEAYYRTQLAAQGEAKILAGRMPTKAELYVLDLSEADARGMMAVFQMDQTDGTADANKSHDTLYSEERPTWKQSELDAAADFPDYDAQQSFLQGESVPYGTKGSVRPDYYTNGHSVDIKNYNLETENGRKNLARNVQQQYFQRLENLPDSTAQAVMIDARGQNVSDIVLNELHDDIMRRTNNGISVLFKMN